MKYTRRQQRNNIRKWIKALRSGQYKQGRGRLVKYDFFCCLGVACEVLKIPRLLDDTYAGEDINLPHIAKCALGLTAHLGNDADSDLILMNDNYRKSFKQIARYIEQQLAKTA